ncbi:MAG: PD-(D/E)XK nuclease family protein [Lachnospiraceae bacterium]|nr:PD-(D/E)XK nuclease family protein [Ruminococcus sp.]MCM1274584.1 PD-(D/E)XK nuclease family protein [Lachnospiraceae bacterium]
MVTFIVAKANFDISARVRSGLVSLLEKSESKRNIVYIVPEQFEYETEKAIYGILDEKGLLSRFDEVKITTFSALSREILEKSGETRLPADDIVKSIIMHKTVNDNKTALSALAKIASRQGFCEKMVQTVSMFKTAGITARDLEESLPNFELDGKQNSPVVKKLAEVGMLYGQYEELISDYIDRLDITGLAADIVAEGGYTELDGAGVFVDCFNDFTGDQLLFLRRVIGKAENVTFGFAAELDGGREVFRTPLEQISRLKRQAEEDGCEIRFVTEGIADRMGEGSPLRELTERLFSAGKSAVELGDSVELVSAPSVYEEVDYAAAKIRQLVSEKGMRYREIAVLCADAGAYGRYVESAFARYDIPVFTDSPEPILYQPLINAVIAALNALRSFNADTVLSCVKTGFFSKFDPEKGERVGLSAKDIDVFESYVYEWALETPHLKKPFTFKNNRLERDAAMEQAEEIRRGVAEPLLKLRKRLPKGSGTIDGAELTELLYKFLTDDIGVQRALFSRCMNENGEGLNAEMVALYQRLWNSLIGIFDALHKELGGVPITLDDYYGLFRDVCSTTTLAKPPQYVDCVLVGDIDRTRADNIRAAFIVGATYEGFPTPAPQSGIFSQYETELLRDNITHFGERCLKSIREQYYLSLYRAYKAVSLPSEFLCVSCPRYDVSGEAVQRSDVIGGILGTFPDARVVDTSELGNKFYCRTEKAAKARYAMGLSRGGRDNAVLKRALEKNGNADFTAMLDDIRSSRTARTADNAAFSGHHRISAGTARRLLPDYIGATAVEKLNACKFDYFCRYGLGIDEKSPRSFNNAKRGDAIHFVLENVLKEYGGDPDGFFGLTRAELYSLSRKYLAEYCRLETNNEFSDDKRTEFLFNNIANSAADVLITVQAEFFARRYRPKFFELDIADREPKFLIDNELPNAAVIPSAELYSEESREAAEPRVPEKSDKYIEIKPLVIRLDNGMEVTLTGRIDRVDAFSVKDENGGRDKVYVRVVDYKSSVREFDLNNTLHGSNLQMLLYLFALCDANKDNPTLTLCPGGVSYAPSKNTGAVEETLSPYRMLAMNYHPNELLISDEVTRSDLEGYLKFVLEKISSEGELDEKTVELIKKTFTPNALNQADAESFDRLRGDVLDAVREELSALFGGDVSALPLVCTETHRDVNGKTENKRKDPCEYCRFGDICGNAGANAVTVEKACAYGTKKEPEWENPYVKKGEEDGDE